MPGRMMPEKLQDALSPVIWLTAMRCALAVAAVKERTSSGCTEYGLMDKVTAISGTSIGAINAVLFACNDPDRSEEAWKKIHFETVFDVDPDLMFNDKSGFMSRREMIKLMDSYVDYGKLSDGHVTVYAAIAECAQEGDRLSI